MDIDAVKQERAQVVPPRVRRVWPNQAAEKWMHGYNHFLEDARPIDLVPLGRIDEMLTVIEVAHA